MRTLIYKHDKFYTTDSLDNKLGKTHITKYTASPDNMPHTYFKNYIVIYGRPTCPYCIRTIELVKKKPKVIFVEIDNPELPELFNKSKLLDILKPEIGTHSTVPIVFDNTKFIGGADDAEGYF